jgi:hypothetical protein
VGAGLHAEGAAAAVKDALDLGRDAVTVGAVLPVEGQQIVIFLVKKNVTQTIVSHGNLLNYGFVSSHYNTTPPRCQ